LRYYNLKSFNTANQMAQSKFCKTCNRKTVHEEFKDQAISGGKIVTGYLTGGLSLLATGVRKGKGLYCISCGTVN
jgi:hypothetical protein